MPIEGTAAREDFGHIDFSGLPNTRDLGGLETEGGLRVLPGRLLRSGALGLGTDADLARLRDDFDVRAVVDFRGDDELAERPDPLYALPQASYLHVSVLDGVVAGISQSQGARRNAEWLRATERDPGLFMETVYPHILLDEAGIAGYSALFRTILATEEGTVLWHCSMGRDRAGLAAALVEHALGVPHDAIERDYLATNRFYADSGQDPMAASGRSLQAALAGVLDAYGTVDGYLERGLGLTREDQRVLRDRYLG